MFEGGVSGRQRVLVGEVGVPRFLCAELVGGGALCRRGEEAAKDCDFVGGGEDGVIQLQVAHRGELVVYELGLGRCYVQVVPP